MRNNIMALHPYKLSAIALAGDSQHAVALVYDPATVIRVFDLNTGLIEKDIIPEVSYP